jgi:predicted regulator of Ras-like GTPase activity (Roadblock/LC7/MglB family)
MGDFVLFKEDVERIQKVLAHVLTESAASNALLIHKDGNLVAQVGFTANMDVTSLAALAAGSFASTRAIAHLIGETEFSVMFHQGAKENIHIAMMDENVILLLVFDDRTNLGLVKISTAHAKQKLEEVLALVRQNQFQGLDDFEKLGHGEQGQAGGDQVMGHIDRLFPGNT